MKKRRNTRNTRHASGPRTHRVVIPERETILDFLREAGRPRTLEHLLAHFHTRSTDVQEALQTRLAAMVRDGQLLLNRRDGYGLIDKLNLVTGRVVGHPDGYGFLVPDDGVGVPVQGLGVQVGGDLACVLVRVGHELPADKQGVG